MISSAKRKLESLFYFLDSASNIPEGNDMEFDIPPMIHS